MHGTGRQGGVETGVLARSDGQECPSLRNDRRLVLALATLALLYAALVNVRTVVDTDLGWQLATGRYVVQHRQIPYHDVFSYTANGAEWIYPVLSGILFYGAYLAGGFAVISLLGVAACAGTAALLLRRAGLATAALAVIAVPAIGYSTLPRANMFSPPLFAASLGLLWRYRRDNRAPLWLLPLLMLAWVNLHVGFEAGLAVIAGYLVLELLELPFTMRRRAAVARLRRAAPWLTAAAAMTLANPWGPRIYAVIVRQERLLEGIKGFVSEWTPVTLSRATIGEVLAWRNPAGTHWWLLAVALAAVAVSLWRKHFGAAVLLAAGAAASFWSLRFQGLFAIVTVMAAGSAFDDVLAARAASPATRERTRPSALPGWRAVLGAAALAVLFLLTGVRISDLVSNRHYLSHSEIATFGVGASPWYPERAAAFLLRERLPGRLWNSYNIGGYLVWRLWPQYSVYIDGRAVPFGPELYYRSARLIDRPPDSWEWQREAGSWSINTVVISVARFGGTSGALRGFCESKAWRPVYLDEVAAVFVRNRPENSAWLDRLLLDCATVPFTSPASQTAGETYNFYANSGAVLFALGRNREALAALERAERIFPDDRHLRLTKSAVLVALGRPQDAERECRTALALAEDDQAWLALASVLASQGRYPEAAQAVERALRFSPTCETYRVLGEIRLAMKQPQKALAAFDEAERRSPYRGRASSVGTAFQVELAMGRAHAWFTLGDLKRAIAFQQQAVAITPEERARWLELAELYRAQGCDDCAQRATRRAESLRR